MRWGGGPGGAPWDGGDWRGVKGASFCCNGAAAAGSAGTCKALRVQGRAAAPATCRAPRLEMEADDVAALARELQLLHVTKDFQQLVKAGPGAKTNAAGGRGLGAVEGSPVAGLVVEGSPVAGLGVEHLATGINSSTCCAGNEWQVGMGLQSIPTCCNSAILCPTRGICRQRGGQPGGAAAHARAAACNADGGGAAAQQEAGEGDCNQGAAKRRGV